MNAKKALVVFYSRSGTTRALAGALAHALDADLEEIRDRKERGGVLGFLRSVLDAKIGRTTRLQPRRYDPADYELVLVGTPVWASAVSAPVRAYLEDNRKRFRSVAFFATEAGHGADRVFVQMSRLARREPTATLILKQHDVLRALAPMNAFLAKLRGEATTFLPVGGEPMSAPAA